MKLYPLIPFVQISHYAQLVSKYKSSYKHGSCPYKKWHENVRKPVSWKCILGKVLGYKYEFQKTKLACAKQFQFLFNFLSQKLDFDKFSIHFKRPKASSVVHYGRFLFQPSALFEFATKCIPVQLWFRLILSYFFYQIETSLSLPIFGIIIFKFSFIFLTL